MKEGDQAAVLIGRITFCAGRAHCRPPRFISHTGLVIFLELGGGRRFEHDSARAGHF